MISGYPRDEKYALTDHRREQVGDARAEIAMRVGDGDGTDADIAPALRPFAAERQTRSGLPTLNLQIEHLGAKARPKILVDPDTVPLRGRLFAAQVSRGNARVPIALETIIEFNRGRWVVIGAVQKEPFAVVGVISGAADVRCGDLAAKKLGQNPGVRSAAHPAR